MRTQLTIAALCTLLTFTSNAFAKRLTQVDWNKATASKVRKYSPKAEARLTPYFEKANVSYPPKKLALLTFKKEQDMELWAKDDASRWSLVKKYPLTANSGTAGPKLHLGDYQIPEGVYRISFLDPYSHYHLSMMLNYPNAFDRNHAHRDRRKQLGDNIFIHGNHLSAGCLAVGDKAIEELFVVISKVGKRNTEVIIAPNDIRHHHIAAKSRKHQQPRWLPELYAKIRKALQKFS